jgi:excisionase family DNA binding protein
MRYLTTAEVAEHLNCSTKTVGRLRASGKLPFQKLGDNIRFRIENVEALLQPGTPKPASGKSWEPTRQSDADVELPPMAMLRPARRAEAA